MQLHLEIYKEFEAAYQALDISNDEWKVRRCIRAMYYDLYHYFLHKASYHLIKHLNEDNVEDKKIAEKIYRSLTHTQCKDFLKNRANKSDYPFLVSCAELFPRLQNLREEADYNPFPFALTKNDLDKLVEQYKEAIFELSMMSEKTQANLILALHFKDRR